MSDCHDTTPAVIPHHAFTLALVGNPNAGKTTLFNALTGLRAKTANFPGTTVERKVGRLHLDHKQIVVVDLPGLYSLDSKSPDEKLAADALQGKLDHTAPSAALVVVDATNLERNLFLVSQVLELKKMPVIVALNMMDMARRDGIRIDIAKMRQELGCMVVAVSARNGEGIQELKQELDRLVTGSMPEALNHADPACAGCTGCTFQARYEWTEKISTKVMDAVVHQRSEWTDRLDDFLTHPVIGVAAFHVVMVMVFALIFWVAKIPMDLIDHLFSGLGAWVAGKVPEGDFQSLLVHGVIGGVGGILVFLPQICILFFALSILEDTGYLSRAAFVMDKVMRRFGLPGKAFVPMLSAHACAIPAIMSTRVIENPRDRLMTILITPLMTCSARIPVYAMVTALLFPNSPLKAGLVFTASYGVGVLTALVAAMVFRRTILPGGSKPLMIELPPYRWPMLRVAALHTFDRAMIFVKQAGTIILAISLILWALSYYPKSAAPATAVALTTQAAELAKAGDKTKAQEMSDEADRLTAQHSLQNSYAGQIGRAIEPAIAPLGFDWQIGIGIFSSFAAREVIVSTLAIVYGVGEDAAENDRNSLYDSLRRAKRTDGSAIFNPATCASLLVFYILAAQCLSTTAVVRRETGTWRWPIFQIVYMTGLAYIAALIVYQVVKHLTHG
ncbi:MAG TPA: ferrous iron transport protein B [Verrucomicrobiae bacterium]